MQIVIDVDDAFYARLFGNRADHYNDALSALYIIRNGTPLPKGHGDLIDRNAFVNKCNADRNHSCYLKSWTADDVLNALQNSYTNVVIEADKEGE